MNKCTTTGGKTFEFQGRIPPQIGQLVKLVPPIHEHPDDSSRAEVRHLLCNKWEWVNEICQSNCYYQIVTDCAGYLNLFYVSADQLKYQRFDASGNRLTDGRDIRITNVVPTQISAIDTCTGKLVVYFTGYGELALFGWNGLDKTVPQTGCTPDLFVAELNIPYDCNQSSITPIAWGCVARISGDKLYSFGQTGYDDNLSCLVNPCKGIGQSFVAECTGYLRSFSVIPAESHACTTIRLYQGCGNTGTELASQSVYWTASPDMTPIVVNLNNKCDVLLVAGQTYTLMLGQVTVLTKNGNPYSAGKALRIGMDDIVQILSDVDLYFLIELELSTQIYGLDLIHGCNGNTYVSGYSTTSTVSFYDANCDEGVIDPSSILNIPTVGSICDNRGATALFIGCLSANGCGEWENTTYFLTDCPRSASIAVDKCSSAVYLSIYQSVNQLSLIKLKPTDFYSRYSKHSADSWLLFQAGH